MLDITTLLFFPYAYTSIRMIIRNINFLEYKFSKHLSMSWDVYIKRITIKSYFYKEEKTCSLLPF